MLHLQNRCICTCTTTIRLDIEHEKKKNSHNHKVSFNVEFPALLSFASRKGKRLSIVVFELKRVTECTAERGKSYVISLLCL